jgi:hypothetical protein
MRLVGLLGGHSFFAFARQTHFRPIAACTLLHASYCLRAARRVFFQVSREDRQVCGMCVSFLLQSNKTRAPETLPKLGCVSQVICVQQCCDEVQASTS